MGSVSNKFAAVLLLGVMPAFTASAQTPSAPRLTTSPPAAVTAPVPQLPLAPAPAVGGGLEDLAIPGQGGAAASAAPGAAAPVAPVRSPEDEALENAVKQLIPMNPDQIRDFRKRQDDARKAQNLPIVPVHPVTRTVSLTLRPGEASPVIRVAAQRVTTITFVDVTGKPWPVLSAVTGDPQTLKVESAGPQNETNIITLSPLRYQGATNVAVTLTKYPVPIVMTVTTGESEVDYRVDMRLAARGPNAAVDSLGQNALGPTNDTTLVAFIDGTPPRGAERVRTGSRDVEAWMFDKMMYVRTTAELMSPAYIARSSGNAGVNVYQLMETPVVIVARDGRMHSVALNR